MNLKDSKVNKPVFVSSNIVFDFFRKEIADTRDTVSDLVRDNRKVHLTTDRKIKAKLEW